MSKKFEICTVTKIREELDKNCIILGADERGIFEFSAHKIIYNNDNIIFIQCMADYGIDDYFELTLQLSNIQKIISKPAIRCSYDDEDNLISVKPLMIYLESFINVKDAIIFGKMAESEYFTMINKYKDKYNFAKQLFIQELL